MAAFKLDENLSPGLRVVFDRAGLDVATVGDQGLQGATDERVSEACRREGRCLVTADQDFAQILLYPPSSYAGIIVLRDPRPSLVRLENLVRQVISALQRESVEGRLWIVEPGRIRISDPA
jgi:predicted nuclease of predicted toxin-antitoxin system